MQAVSDTTQIVNRLLLVEDDPLVGETIAAMLEDDYDIILATTAASAMQCLTGREPPAVILLDCLLPDGGTANLLAEADRLGLFVVLTSGDPREADCLGTHRPFLPKPFHQAALLKVLDGAA